MGELTNEAANEAIAAANTDARRITELPISQPVVTLASNLTRDLPLRALDAIQLATALTAQQRDPSAPLTFVSADYELLNATEYQGLAVLNPLTPPIP